MTLPGVKHITFTATACGCWTLTQRLPSHQRRQLEPRPTSQASPYLLSPGG